MKDLLPTQGVPEGRGLRFAVVASRFNERLCDLLTDGAVECLRQHGIAEGDLCVVRVPGAFEIPLALAELAERGEVDGLVALGVVIRGETPHFDYVCSTASQGVQQVSLQHRLPVGFGILTCDDQEQAAARAGGRGGDADHGKGWEAALAALEMADLMRRLRDDSEAGDGGGA